MKLLSITPQLLAMGIPQVENIIDTLPNHPTKVFQQRPMESVDTWILHHTASEAPLINQARFHVNKRNWARIGYSIMIVDGSRIVQTNYLDVEAVHCAGWNHRSLGVCVLGDLSKRQLTPRERELLIAVFISLEAMYPGRQIKGHGECKPTSCPVISMPNLRADIESTEELLAYKDSPSAQLVRAYALTDRVSGLYSGLNGKYGKECNRKLMLISPIEGLETTKEIYERICKDLYKKAQGGSNEALRKLALYAEVFENGDIL